MPTDREREYYRMGYEDGVNSDIFGSKGPSRNVKTLKQLSKAKPKRKLSDWQKFIKANSNKKKFKFANGKLKLKSMGIAYRKTAAYKRNKKK